MLTPATTELTPSEQLSHQKSPKTLLRPAPLATHKLNVTQELRACRTIVPEMLNCTSLRTTTALGFGERSVYHRMALWTWWLSSYSQEALLSRYHSQAGADCDMHGSASSVSLSEHIAFLFCVRRGRQISSTMNDLVFAVVFIGTSPLGTTLSSLSSLQFRFQYFCLMAACAPAVNIKRAHRDLEALLLDTLCHGWSLRLHQVLGSCSSARGRQG